MTRSSYQKLYVKRLRRFKSEHGYLHRNSVHCPKLRIHASMTSILLILLLLPSIFSCCCSQSIIIHRSVSSECCSQFWRFLLGSLLAPTSHSVTSVSYRRYINIPTQNNTMQYNTML